MKKLLLAVVTALVFNLPAFAADGDFKTLAPKILKAPKSSSLLKSPKNDVAIVYGGEDITRKITDTSFTA